MNDRCMESEFAGLVWTQLVTNGLLDLVRHTPDTNQFRADLGEVVSDARLFHFGER